MLSRSAREIFHDEASIFSMFKQYFKRFSSDFAVKTAWKQQEEIGLNAIEKKAYFALDHNTFQAKERVFVADHGF